jgi:hypothetical protein
VPLTLIEESPLIYLWDAEDSAPVSPAAPTIYNPLNSPFILGTVDASVTAVWDSVTGSGKPEDFATRNNPAGVHSTSLAYNKGDLVRNAAGDATYIAKQNVPTGIALTNTVYWDLFVQGTGTPGENAISAFLTNSAHVVATALDGTGGDYSTAGGTMRVFDGFVEKTTSGTVTFSKVGTGSWYSINSSGVYTISDPGSDTATAQFDASYSGVTVRLTYSIAKSRTGATGAKGDDGADGAAGTPAISAYLTNESVGLFAYANGDVVSYAPATGNFVIVSGNTDISASFSLSVPGGGNPQGLAVSFTGRTYTITGGFDTNEDTATLTIRATGSGAYAAVTIDKVFNLSKTKGGYEIVATLPTTNLFEGRVVYLTLEDKLYRYTGASWSAEVPATDITGQLTNAQIAAVAASKVTGQLSDSQLAAISAAKVTGQITGTQITDSAISTPKIAAGAVTSNEIAAATILAGNIAASTITATQIAASTITGAKIAAGTIEAGNIATGAITADKVFANAITADKIASNAVTADKINAGAVTAAKISVTDLSSVSATIGLLRTATSGQRMEIESNQLRVYDSSGVLRVRLGIW